MIVDLHAAHGSSTASGSIVPADPSAPAYVAIHPCGVHPKVSNVNVRAAPATANHAMIDGGAAGDVCVFSSTSTHVIIDVEAWIS